MGPHNEWRDLVRRNLPDLRAAAPGVSHRHSCCGKNDPPRGLRNCVPSGRGVRSRGLRTDEVHRIIRPSGELRTVHSQGDVRKDASGRPYKMFGTVQDITDRKRAEEALQRSQFYISEGQRVAHMGRLGLQRSWIRILVLRVVSNLWS